MDNGQLASISNMMGAVFGPPPESRHWKRHVAELAMMLALDVGLEKRFMKLVSDQRREFIFDDEVDRGDAA